MPNGDLIWGFSALTFIAFDRFTWIAFVALDGQPVAPWQPVTPRHRLSLLQHVKSQTIRISHRQHGLRDELPNHWSHTTHQNFKLLVGHAANAFLSQCAARSSVSGSSSSGSSAAGFAAAAGFAGANGSASASRFANASSE